jgi:octaprenyl-diphosphate synthase
MTPVDQELQAALDDVEHWLRDRILQLHASYAAWAIDAAEFTAGLNTRGKQIRPRLLLLANRIAGGRYDPGVRTVAGALELAHVVSLLFDDIQDNASTRRGVPAHHVTNGVSATMSLCAVLFRLVVLMLAETPGVSPARAALLVRRFMETQVATAVGQMAEAILARDGVLDTSADTYFKTIRGKTATVFGFAAEAGARLAAGDDDGTAATFHQLGETLGCLFQLADDYADLFLEYEGKPRLQDLREAKRTLFFLHTRRALPATERAVLDRLYRQSSRSETDVQWIADRMKDTGAALAVQTEAERLSRELDLHVAAVAALATAEDAHVDALRALIHDVRRGIPAAPRDATGPVGAD